MRLPLAIRLWLSELKHSFFHSSEVAGKTAALSEEGRRMLYVFKPATVIPEKRVLSGSISDRLRRSDHGI